MEVCCLQFITAVSTWTGLIPSWPTRRFLAIGSMSPRRRPDDGWGEGRVPRPPGISGKARVRSPNRLKQGR